MRIDRMFESNYMIEEGLLVAPGREQLFLVRDAQTGPWVAVTFKPASSRPWAARFQGSLTGGLTAVATTPDPNQAVVTASGQLYIVNCKYGVVVDTTDHQDIIDIINCLEDNMLVLVARWGAVGVGSNGIAWEQHLNEMRIEIVDHDTLVHVKLYGMSYSSGKATRKCIRCATGTINTNGQIGLTDE